MRASNSRPRGGSKALKMAGVSTAALLSLCVASTAASQESPRPSLAGHTFVSTDLLPEAFVRTYVRSSFGYAQTADINYSPVVVSGDTLRALNGSLAYVLLGVEYQHAVRDWMAVHITGAMRSRLGTQLSSLVTEGVTVTSGIEIGWLARLRQTEKSALCGSFAVTNQTITVIDVKQFAEDVAGGVQGARLLEYVPTVRATGGLRYARAISRPFGFTLLAEGSYGEPPRRHEGESWGFGGGASVDFDAGAAWGVPLGAALAYRRTSQSAMTTSDNGYASQTVLRLAYNGRPDFLIALDFLGVFDLENTKASSIWAGGAGVSLRYYF